MMSLTLPRAAACLAALLTLAACDSADVESPAFTAAVTGDRTASLEGEGTFGVPRALPWIGTPGFEVRLMDSGDELGVSLWRSSTVPLEVGTYAFTAPGDEILDTSVRAFLLNMGDGPPYYHATEGTLTIEEASPERMRGSFVFTGAPLEEPDREISISGQFDITEPANNL